MYTINPRVALQNNILLNYFNSNSVTLEELCEAVKTSMYVFEELKLEVIKREGETEINFIEVDEFSSVLILTIYLNSKNEIKLVERDMSIVTPANKLMTLFLGSLIDKRVEL